MQETHTEDQKLEAASSTGSDEADEQLAQQAAGVTETAGVDDSAPEAEASETETTETTESKDAPEDAEPQAAAEEESAEQAETEESQDSAETAESPEAAESQESAEEEVDDYETTFVPPTERAKIMVNATARGEAGPEFERLAYTLAFHSPERSERMHRFLDHRLK